MKKYWFCLLLVLSASSFAASADQGYNVLNMLPNPANNGEYVALIGKNFTKDSKVYMNGAELPSTLISDTIIRVQIPFNYPVSKIINNRVTMMVLTINWPTYSVWLGYLYMPTPTSACQPEVLTQNLIQLRSAASIYYADTEGLFPASLRDLSPKYIPSIPNATICKQDLTVESNSTQVSVFPSISAADGRGGWGYVNDIRSPDYGAVFINSKSNGPNGQPWFKY